MSLHLRTTKAVFIRKITVGAAFFLLSVLAFHGLVDLTRIHISAEVGWAVYGLLALIAFAAVVILKPVDHAAKRVLRDYVMRRECYSHILLTDLSEELHSVLQLRELANLVVNSFAESFHLKTVGFFVFRNEAENFEPVSSFGWPASELRRAKLSKHSLLAEIMQHGGEHVLTRNVLLKSVSWQDATSLEHDFNFVRAGWILPFVFKGELLGFMAFASESPDRIFEKADFEFFIRFARKVSVCLRNALEVEELLKCNTELKDAQSHRFQTSKHKAVSQLAEGLAHEIHNPLAIISGKAQVLLFKKGDIGWEKRVEEALTVIIQQSKRAADITRKVLASVRESQAPVKEIDLWHVARGATGLLSYQAALKQIEVSVDAEENICMQAQPGDMHELFTGLIQNAVERLGSHGWVRINLRRMRNEDAAEILVMDNGYLPPETIEHIFDPFFKTRHEALGLGLFAVKQIIHRYGGNIRAESRESDGTLFQIKLPLGAQVTNESEESLAPVTAPERN